MNTKIYHYNPLGELEEVKQEWIDEWCRQCQFPYGQEKCSDPELVQMCWFGLQGMARTLGISAEAHIWHLQHECPFIHTGVKCRCNDFKTIKEAFQSLGIEYK